MFEAAIILVSKIIKMFPDYEKRKREQFYKLLEKYENEKLKDYKDRDDNDFVHYRRELRNFIKAFSGEISGKNL